MKLTPDAIDFGVPIEVHRRLRTPRTPTTTICILEEMCNDLAAAQS